ncbi:MAG TPA: hypothetical protein DEB40_06485 [Elusimicrobia bacterium]|nr:hypothetical protein [Elusimicrobiota bacterium]HBT61374.1 hypothetical protein [Elusimicrobiota bacterium]
MRAEAWRQQEGRLVSRVLRIGMWASGVLMAAGLILAALRPAPLPAGSPRWGLILREAFCGNGAALALLGILALVATPYLRVALLVVTYARARQWRFLAVSLAVLAMLTLGLLL